MSIDFDMESVRLRAMAMWSHRLDFQAAGGIGSSHLSVTAWAVARSCAARWNTWDISVLSASWQLRNGHARMRRATNTIDAVLYSTKEAALSGNVLFARIRYRKRLARNQSRRAAVSGDSRN